MALAERIPETMLAIAYDPKQGLHLARLRTAEVLGLPLNEFSVIITVITTGLCSSDIPYLKNDSWAQENGLRGRAIGHELFGRVIEIGPGLDRDDWLGKMVAVESHVPKYRPDWPKKPWYDPEIMRDGFSVIGFDAKGGDPISGAWGLYVVVPCHNAYRLSNQVLDRLDGWGHLLEPSGNAVFTVLEAIRLLGENSGLKPENAKIVVCGLGQQGQLMTYIARLMGFGKIAAIDVRPEPVKAVKSLGVADGVILNQGQDRLDQEIIEILEGPADLVIDAYGSPGVISQAAGPLKDEKGIIIAFGLGEKGENVPGVREKISLGELVFGQRVLTAEIKGKRFTLAGVCGRSPQSWEWLIKALRSDSGSDLGEIIRQRTVCIGRMPDFAGRLAEFRQEGPPPNQKLMMLGWPSS